MDLRPHGAHGEGAMTTKPIPEGTRAVLFSEGLMERMFTRTEDGRRLTIEWGEPDADGFYTPRFTASEDEWYREHVALNGALDTADAETVARWFHEAYETLAPRYHYATRSESAVPWENVPVLNRGLMIATAREVLRRLRGAD